MNIMKNALIFILLCSNCCNAQVQEKLEGYWLPEKYVYAITENDTSNLNEYLFPVERFEISKKRTTELINYFGIESANPEQLIVIKTYKSEHNTILTEKVLHGNREKYKLPHFSSYLNMKYVPRETVNRYAKSEVYISKRGNKLLLESIENGEVQEIYFIRNDNK